MRDVMLITHFLGLAMGVGTAIGFMFLGMAAGKMEKNEGQQFMIKALTMGRMGHIGLVLLFISGGYLMTPYWSTLGSNPLLTTKLILFLVLAALIGIVSSTGKKAQKGDAEKHLQKAALLGRITLLVSIVIVILAVLIFH